MRTCKEILQEVLDSIGGGGRTVTFTDDDIEELKEVLSHQDDNGVASPAQDGWRIDTSTGREILVYKNCSVIEEEDARFVLSLIAAHHSKAATPHTDQRAELPCESGNYFIPKVVSGKAVMVEVSGPPGYVWVDEPTPAQTAPQLEQSGICKICNGRGFVCTDWESGAWDNCSSCCTQQMSKI